MEHLLTYDIFACHDCFGCNLSIQKLTRVTAAFMQAYCRETQNTTIQRHTQVIRVAAVQFLSMLVTCLYLVQYLYVAYHSDFHRNMESRNSFFSTASHEQGICLCKTQVVELIIRSSVLDATTISGIQKTTRIAKA